MASSQRRRSPATPPLHRYFERVVERRISADFASPQSGVTSIGKMLEEQIDNNARERRRPQGGLDSRDKETNCLSKRRARISARNARGGGGGGGERIHKATFLPLHS